MKRLNYHYIIVIISCFFIGTLGIKTIPDAHAGMFTKLSKGVIEKLSKVPSKKIRKISKNISYAGTKTIPDAVKMGKKFNIPSSMLSSPAVRKVAMMAEEIASKSRFSAKFINKSSMPEEIVRQYSRYGKNLYLSVAEKTSKIMVKKNKSSISLVLSNIKSKYKGMNAVINKFNAGKYDGDIMVRTIKRTGNSGVKLFKWAANHPKTTTAGAAIAWYSYDSEGFTEALDRSGKKLGAFIGETFINISGGMGTGVYDGLKQSLDKQSTQSVVVGASVIGFALLLFMSNTFRRLLFFPLTLVGLKLDKKMDDMEGSQPIRDREKNNQNVQKDRKRPTKQPRSNL